MKWKAMDSAPRDGTRILIKTGDFGIVEGWWDVAATNFYASQEGWASYDPDNMQGDWVSDWPMNGDRRLYCGATPHLWMLIPTLPPEETR